MNDPADPTGDTGDSGDSGETGASPHGLRRSSDIDRAYLHHRLHQRTNTSMRGTLMRIRLDYTDPLTGRRSMSAADAAMRASDAERNEVADTLSQHFTDGRLDQTEFKERLDKAMGAITRGDLVGLCDDLPRLRTAPPPPPPPAGIRRRRLLHLVFIIAFVALAAGITVPFVPFTHGLHISWLFFVVAGFFFFWSQSGYRHRHRHSHSAPELED
jgi:uncharacterized protein DUF1707